MEIQYVEGPKHYNSVEEALLGFINRLEEECHHNRWLVGAAVDKPDQQMADVRSKNTDLMRINQELEERINNQAATIDNLMKQKASSVKVEHIFRVPDHDLGFAEFVQETDRWQRDTFADTAKDNAMALFEEATEVAQLYGFSMLELCDKVSKVMDKPFGTLIQELGGVAITLAGLIARSSLEPRAVLMAALQDCWARQDEIRQKKGIVRAVGVGKMVPGALERLRAQGINVTYTNEGFSAAQAIVDERKEFGDPYVAAEADAQQRLKQHIADAAAPHGKA